MHRVSTIPFCEFETIQKKSQQFKHFVNLKPYKLKSQQFKHFVNLKPYKLKSQKFKPIAFRYLLPFNNFPHLSQFQFNVYCAFCLQLLIFWHGLL